MNYVTQQEIDAVLNEVNRRNEQIGYPKRDLEDLRIDASWAFREHDDVIVPKWSSWKADLRKNLVEREPRRFVFDAETSYTCVYAQGLREWFAEVKMEFYGGAGKRTVRTCAKSEDRDVAVAEALNAAYVDASEIRARQDTHVRSGLCVNRRPSF